MPRRPASGHSRCGTVNDRFSTGAAGPRGVSLAVLTGILALPLIAATALAQSGAPTPMARAETVARATIVNPVTLRIGRTGEAARIERGTQGSVIVPRPVIRDCPDTAPRCATIVFDLP
jgi:hypothetical protein